MKHFRTHNYKEALQALESDTNIMLEDPQLTELHNILVINADYDATEKFLENSVRSEYTNIDLYFIYKRSRAGRAVKALACEMQGPELVPEVQKKKITILMKQMSNSIFT